MFFRIFASTKNEINKRLKYGTVHRQIRCSSRNRKKNKNPYLSDVTLATKEQCDTLMKTMADAGYTFDFENKKLMKAESKFNIYGK